MTTLADDATAGSGTRSGSGGGRSRRRAALLRLAGLAVLVALVVVVVDQGDLLGLPAVALTLVVWVGLLASSIAVTGWRAAHGAWPRVRGLGEDVARAVGQVPEVRQLREGSHVPDVLRPVARFGGRVLARAGRTLRRDPASAAWLLVAVACVVALIALWTVVRGDPPPLDRRVVDLSTQLDLPTVRRAMLAITALAEPVSGTLLAALVAAAAWRWSGLDAALLVVCPPALSTLVTAAVKLVVERQRPAMGQLAESSHSWPSGHSTLGLSLALGIVLLAAHVGLRWRPVAALVVPLGLLVGYSRAYLTVHWTTDVAAGWLVALLVASLVALVVGVGTDDTGTSDGIDAEAEAERDGGGPARTDGDGDASGDGRRAARRIPAWVVAGLVALEVVVAVRGSSTALERPPEEPPAAVDGLGPVLASLRDDPRAATLLGRPLGPVNVLLVADRATVTAALDDAGWTTTDAASPARTLGAAVDRVRGVADPSAPVAPAFLGVQVQDLAARQPAGGDDEALRRLRLWQQDVTLPDGCAAWVGTAALTRQEPGLLGALLPETRIAPPVDVQRDAVARSLTAGGALGRDGTVALLPPTLGDLAGGGQFFTDGGAVVLRQVDACTPG